MIAVRCQSMNRFAQHAVKERPSTIAPHAHELFLLLPYEPNSYCLLGALQLHVILLTRHELRPIAHCSGKIRRKRKVRDDMHLSFHFINAPCASGDIKPQTPFSSPLARTSAAPPAAPQNEPPPQSE